MSTENLKDNHEMMVKRSNNLEELPDLLLDPSNRSDTPTQGNLQATMIRSVIKV